MNTNMSSSHVVVGYDGSAASRAALRRAAEAASARRLPLAVCHAWRWPYPRWVPAPGAVETTRRAASYVLDDGIRRVPRAGGLPDVSGRLVEGTAAGVLVTLSHDAALVVVGARGAGGFADLPVGSVAVQVAAHASCPVLVVPRTPPARGPVVVGVDGSPAGEAALALAFGEAALRRVPVRVVRDAAVGSEHAPGPWLERYPNVEVTTAVAVEPPHDALLEAAVGACLLVVGDRGTGTPPALLGAVARRVLHDPPCPVAVVHADTSSGLRQPTGRASTRPSSSYTAAPTAARLSRDDR